MPAAEIQPRRKTVYGLHVRRAPAVIYPVQHLKYNPEGEHGQSQADPCPEVPIRLKAAELKAGYSLPAHKKEAEKPPQVNQVARLPCNPLYTATRLL